jgi:hypothetical protein
MLQGSRHRIAVLFPPPRAPLNVREQEGDRSRWLGGHGFAGARRSAETLDPSLASLRLSFHGRLGRLVTAISEQGAERPPGALLPPVARAEEAQGGVITGSIQPFSHEIISPRDPASGPPTGE